MTRFMMKRILIIYGLLFHLLSSAQSHYEKGMENAFILGKDGQHDETSTLFERIATTQNENGLPAYDVV